VIHGGDEAIWNRIIPIPCTRQVDTVEKDIELKKKLLLEREGIASWVVAGGVRWFSEGLARPEIILRTREEWREGMDIIGQFIEECCLLDGDGQVEGSALYARFAEWYKKQGHEHIMTQTAFGIRLGDRGFEPLRTVKNQAARPILDRQRAGSTDEPR
jgi:putative DNA primase/helicase